MKLKDKYQFIKREKRKNQMKIGIIITLISIVAIIISSFAKSVDYYIAHDVMEKYDYNYYFVSADEENSEEELIEKLKDINHVHEVFDQLERESHIHFQSIGDEKIKGDFALVGKSEEDLRNMSSAYEDKNTILCPEKMVTTDLKKSTFINRWQMLDMRKYKGKVMNISNYIAGTNFTYEWQLKVADLVEVKNTEFDENTCYVSRKLIREISDRANEAIGASESYGSVIVSIDDTKNVDEVLIDMIDMGYWGSPAVWIEEDNVNFVKMMKYYSGILSIVFVVIFIIKLNKDNMNYRLKDHKILKSMGMSNKDYKSIILLENGFVLLKCFIFIIILLAVLFLLKSLVLFFYPFIFSKIEIKVDYLFIITYFILISVVSLFVTSRHLKTIEKNNIQKG